MTPRRALNFGAGRHGIHPKLSTGGLSLHRSEALVWRWRVRPKANRFSQSKPIAKERLRIRISHGPAKRELLPRTCRLLAFTKAIFSCSAIFGRIFPESRRRPAKG